MAAPTSAARPYVEKQTVLLVDDDRTILQVLRKLLQQQGYTVLFAGDGETALKLFRLHGRPIDLLMCDIVMPHVSGPQLAERIRAQDPRIPVVFISGLMQHSAVQAWINDGARFLRKPIHADQLAATMRALLPGSGTA